MLLREIETIEEEAPETEAAPIEASLPEEVIQRYYPAILAFARRKLGNTHDAEDAAQETFARIQQGLSGYGGRSSMTTWFYVVGRNTVYDCLRRRRRSARTTSWTDDLERRDVPAAGAPCRLDEIVARLPPADRQMMLWIFDEKKSMRQIAAETNEPLYRVRRRFHRALKSLRAHSELHLP